VSELSNEAVARHVEFGSRLPTLQTTMHLYPIDGAAHRVGKNDTAFSYRDANWAEVIVGFSQDPGEVEQLRSWVVSCWDAYTRTLYRART
jgi:hypothetical protein